MKKYKSKLTIQKINSIEGENFLIFGKNGNLFAKAYNRPDADLIASIPVKENRISEAIRELNSMIGRNGADGEQDVAIGGVIRILEGVKHELD